MASEPLSDRSPFPLVAEELRRQVDASLVSLQAMTPADAARPRAPGKWSPKQVIGHLIDSAANNHQRFVRAQQAPSLEFPGYAQDHWVSTQHHQERPWEDLLGLWGAYNHHLAHVIGHISEDQRGVMCRIGASAAVTLGSLAHDYVAHLRHHLQQIPESSAGAAG